MAFITVAMTKSLPKLYKFLRLSTYIGCLFGFVFNSFEVFQKFIQSTTLVLSYTQGANELPLPVFVFCNGSSYKQFTNVSIYRREEYLKQTRDHDTFLRRIYLYGSDQDLDSNLYSKSELLTSIYGRCLSFKLVNKIKSGETLMFVVNNTQKVKLFLFYPDDEIMSIYDWFPYDVPKPIIIDPDSAQTYLTVSLKAIKDDWHMGNKLIDCFKKEFSANTNTSCHLPWVHHFTKESNTSSKHCTNAELKAQFDQEFELVPKILLGRESVCIGIKNDVTFQWTSVEYDYFSYPFEELGITRGSHLIYVNYPNMEVKIENEVPFVDFNCFITSVGGALGLFLGFSIIDTLTYLYDFLLWRL